LYTGAKPKKRSFFKLLSELLHSAVSSSRYRNSLYEKMLNKIYLSGISSEVFCEETFFNHALSTADYEEFFEKSFNEEDFFQIRLFAFDDYYSLNMIGLATLAESSWHSAL